MAYPVELLTDHAMCDEALADIQTDLDELTYRQTTYDHRGDQVAARATDITEELETLNDDITHLTDQLAEMGTDSKLRPHREAELRTAVKRQGDLAAAKTKSGPVAAFRSAVKLRQVAAQVTELTTAKTEIIAHRATLSS